MRFKLLYCVLSAFLFFSGKIFAEKSKTFELANSAKVSMRDIYKALANKSYEVRFRAIVTIIEQKETGMIDALIRILKTEKNPYYHSLVGKALRKLTGQTFSNSYKKWRTWRLKEIRSLWDEAERRAAIKEEQQKSGSKSFIDKKPMLPGDAKKHMGSGKKEGSTEKNKEGSGKKEMPEKPDADGSDKKDKENFVPKKLDEEPGDLKRIPEEEMPKDEGSESKSSLGTKLPMKKDPDVILYQRTEDIFKYRNRSRKPATQREVKDPKSDLYYRFTPEGPTYKVPVISTELVN